MKVSYNWLQTYFKEKLPTPEKLAELLTFHVFEIESLEKTHDGKDSILDVKVLPDRARYALSHRGIAYEIAAILNVAQIQKENSESQSKIPEDQSKKPEIKVENSEACVRYMARFAGDITVGESPGWLKEKLEAVGQRSINSVVDSANYVMLDIGQPLHAFDADKISGNITVRFAKAEEKITTLDNKEVILDDSILIIADNAGPLAIAGIKGGNRAAVTETTKNIIIESANFDSDLIRKTTQKIGIRTDSSKRYENAIGPEYTEIAIQEITDLISELAKPKVMSAVTDMYPNPVSSHIFAVSEKYIQDRLGVEIPEKEISDILNRLLLKHEKSGDEFTITIPTWRGDLMISEDIVEEVGRIYGYDKIPTTELPAINFKPQIVKEFYYENKIKDILVSLGFSEVYTYALTEIGDIELEKSIASDKNFLRSNLSENLAASLELNSKNADLLGLDQIKLFEIGNVFTNKAEERNLAIAVKNTKKLKTSETDVLKTTLPKLSEALEIASGKLEKTGKIQDNIFEVNLDSLIKDLPESQVYGKVEILKEAKKFQPISPYPFSVRDIAVFTPEGTEEKEVRNIIEKNAGDLLVRSTLFDIFTKNFPDGSKKTSYAFRLVLQSQEKTLTEEEINTVMKKITEEMNGKNGWQVR